MKVALATTLFLASLVLCENNALFAVEPSCGWPAEPTCGCDAPNRPCNSCRCSKCRPTCDSCKKEQEAEAQGAPAEGKQQMAPPAMTPQMFSASPQIASVQPGGPGLGVGGGAISMPAISIGLPRIELPGLFRTRRQPRARVESSSASFVGHMQAAVPVAHAAAASAQAAPAASAQSQSECDCSQEVMLEKLMLLEKLSRLMDEGGGASPTPQAAPVDEKAELKKKIDDLEAKIQILTEHLEGTLKFKTSQLQNPTAIQPWPVQHKYPVQATNHYQPTVCRTPVVPYPPLQADRGPSLVHATPLAPVPSQYNQAQFHAQSPQNQPYAATNSGQWTRPSQSPWPNQAMTAGMPNGGVQQVAMPASPAMPYPHSPAIISVRPVVRANGP